MTVDTDLDPDPPEGSAELAAWVDDDSPASPGGPLFDGDTGQLDSTVRALLVTLLKRRYISADLHPKEWQALLDNEADLRSRLHDLFLDLVVDRSYEVAFKRQAVSESGSRFPTLLTDKAYGREETILLVFLRHELRKGQETEHTDTFIYRSELLDEVAAHRPDSATDRSGDEKRAAKAVERLEDMRLLIETGERDRFRIAPILEVLLPLEKLNDLLQWLTTTTDTDSNPVRLDAAPALDLDHGDADGDDLSDVAPDEWGAAP